jgi:ferritin-like metal-binding protein YciE
MEGLIDEGKEAMSDAAESAVCDAALIAAAQRVEHYEMAGYGCARTYAHMLGNERAASLLQQTLMEEKETDEKLTRLAEEMVNVQAVGASSREG